MLYAFPREDGKPHEKFVEEEISFLRGGLCGWGLGVFFYSWGGIQLLRTENVTQDTSILIPFHPIRFER